MEKFRGVDYYGVETLLSDEERMVRDAVRDWVEAEFLPLVTEHHRAGTFPMAVVPQAGRARHLRREPEGLRLRGAVERGLRADHAGARARGLGAALLRLRPERARHVSDPPFRVGRPEGPLAAGAPAGRRHRLLRPHRARPRLRSRRDGDPRRPAGRPLRPERHQALDHERLGRRRGRRVGQGRRRRDRRLPRREGHAGLRRPRHPRQVLDARVDHLGALLPGLPHPRSRTGCPAPRASGGRSACLSQARYGIAWGAVGAAQACYDWALQYAKTRVQFGKPIAGVPARPAEARVDGHRDHQGAAPVPPARAPQGRPGACGPSRCRWPR